MLKANNMGGSGCTGLLEVTAALADQFNRAPIHGVVAALSSLDAVQSRWIRGKPEPAKGASNIT
jgi:hypothetical protein